VTAVYNGPVLPGTARVMHVLQRQRYGVAVLQVTIFRRLLCRNSIEF
jgi:hypothetical protein